jgi:hypothetical protein
MHDSFHDKPQKIILISIWQRAPERVIPNHIVVKQRSSGMQTDQEVTYGCADLMDFLD